MRPAFPTALKSGAGNQVKSTPNPYIRETSDAPGISRGQFDRANVGSGHTADELAAIFSALDVDKNGVVTFGR